MRLISLDITNFKGISALHIDLDGCDMAIYGDNATGKTTIFDAFLWLLFGKDSTGRTAFEVKPLGPDGKVRQAGVEVAVEATIEHSDAQHTLRRTYAEKWVRRRGSAEAVLQGHETTYTVDALPLSQGQYTDYISSLIPEDRFRLLTNPYHFASLKWQERRSILFGLVGDVADQEVLDSDPKFLPLSEAIGTHTVDNFRKVLADRRKKTNDELNRLPTRIDEATRSIVEVEDASALQSRADDLGAQRSAIEAQLIHPDTGDLRARAAKIEAQLAKIRSDMLLDATTAKSTWERSQRERLDAVRAQMDALGDDHQSEINQALRDISRLTSDSDRLRLEWSRINDEMPPVETACPHCKRAYDAQSVQAATESYNIGKADRLAAISAKGLANKVDIEALQSTVASLQAKSKAVQDQKQSLWDKIDAIKAERYAAPTMAMPPEAAVLESELADLRQQVAAIESGVVASNATVQAKIASINASIQACLDGIARAKLNAATKTRITELMAQQKSLAAEMESIEGLQFLAEDFIRAKTDMIQSRVDGEFDLARFRLFTEQINGGVIESCDITVDGVPYADLNHAAQVNVGLDIIRTLSRHYGVSAPVFVDNAESVTALIPVDCQLILLVVSESDKQLRAVAGQQK